MESRQRLARNVLPTFASPPGLVHDLADTDCWGQTVSSRNCFHDFQMLFFNRQDKKFDGKTLLVLLNFIPIVSTWGCFLLLLRFQHQQAWQMLIQLTIKQSALHGVNQGQKNL